VSARQQLAALLLVAQSTHGASVTARRVKQQLRASQQRCRWATGGASPRMARLPMQIGDSARRLGGPAFGDEKGCAPRLCAAPFFARAVCARANR
jgi:hypothetical protein